MIEYCKTKVFRFDRYLYYGLKSLYRELSVGFRIAKSDYYVDVEINLMFIRVYIGYNWDLPF